MPKPKKIVAAVQFERAYFDEDSARMWMAEHGQRVYKIKFFPKSILILARPASDFRQDTFTTRQYQPGITVRAGVPMLRTNPTKRHAAEQEAEDAFVEALEEAYEGKVEEFVDDALHLENVTLAVFEQVFEATREWLEDPYLGNWKPSKELAEALANMNVTEKVNLFTVLGLSIYSCVYQPDPRIKQNHVVKYDIPDLTKKWTKQSDIEARMSEALKPYVSEYINIRALFLGGFIFVGRLALLEEQALLEDSDIEQLVEATSWINVEIQDFNIIGADIQPTGYFSIFLDEHVLLDAIEGKEKEEEEEEIVYTYPSGFYVVKLTTAAQLKEEGARLGHCLGQKAYVRMAKTGERDFYSLRTASGKSKFTFEVVPKGWRDASYPIKQIKGTANRIPGLTHEQTDRQLVHETIRIAAFAINEGILTKETDLPIGLNTGPKFSIYEVDDPSAKGSEYLITEQEIEWLDMLFDGPFKPVEVYLVAEFLREYLKLPVNSYFGGMDFYKQWAWVKWNNIPQPNPYEDDEEDWEEDDD